MTGKILVRTDGAVGHLIINNPAERNAMSTEMWQAFDEALIGFMADDQVRVLVLSGTGGKSFVSGISFKALDGDASARACNREAMKRSMQRLFDFEKPVIAAIDGHCIAAGCSVAIRCDIRLCTDRSRFAYPAGSIGMGYSHDNMQLVFDLIGPAAVKELYLLSKQYSGQEAQAIGLVHRSVPESEFDAVVQEYVQALAEAAPLALRQVKVTAQELLKPSPERSFTRSEHLLKQVLASEDLKEGIRALAEKRKPRFKGS